jgi:hypothetical protein
LIQQDTSSRALTATARRATHIPVSGRGGNLGGGGTYRGQALPEVGDRHEQVVAAGHQRLCKDRVGGVRSIENPHAFLLGGNMNAEDLNGPSEIIHHLLN